MTHCQNCGAEAGCGRPDCDGSEQPSCLHPPEHCGKCPPWRCEDCDEQCSAEKLCSCWIPLEGMALADIKAVFAASDMSIGLPEAK